MQAISRRGFVAGGIGLGAAAASVAVAGAPVNAPAAETDWAQPSAHITPVAEEFVKPAVNETDVVADEVVETEYLVVGSGNCGLLSAARASELGVKVVMLEYEATTGGSSYGTEAHFALDNCKYVADAGMKTWTIPEAADYFNLYNEFHSTQTLVMSFLRHCGEPYDWWIEKGATINQLLTSLAGPNTAAGMFFDGKAAALADIDRKVIEENGVDVRTNAEATNLVVDDDGNVVGALATTPEGTLFVKAQATFVGTGGFGNNPEMVNAYMGARGNAAIVGDTILHHNGDGINMMLGAGAITGVLDSTQPGGIQVKGTYYEGDITRAASEPFLWVNKYGQRVGCEYWTNPTYGYALVAWSPDYYVWTILDQTRLERMETENFFNQSKYLPYTYDPVPNMREQFDEAIEAGTVIKAETIEELADACGIAKDGLLATIATYNAACAAGEDDVFFKPAEMLMPVEDGPFYALKLECNRLSSLNGVMINEDCKVIDADGNWITGLYAGGLDSAGFFMADYNHAFSGSCSSYSFFTGWHAAETVAKELGKN